MAFGSPPPATSPNRHRTGCLAFAALAAALLAYVIGNSVWDGLSRSTARSKAYDQLAAQRTAWNEGNLSAFTATYRIHGDTSFFSDGRVYTGWEEINDRYRVMYAGRPMGELSYDDVVIDVLAPDAVVIRGKWSVKSEGGTRRGLFTILARKFPSPEGWKIVHDHITIGEMR